MVAHGLVWKDWACNVKLQRCSNIFILDCYWVQCSHCISSSLKRGSIWAQMYDPINIQEYVGCNQTDGHILLTKITLLYNFSWGEYSTHPETHFCIYIWFGYHYPYRKQIDTLRVESKQEMLALLTNVEWGIIVWLFLVSWICNKFPVYVF